MSGILEKDGEKRENIKMGWHPKYVIVLPKCGLCLIALFEKVASWMRKKCSQLWYSWISGNSWIHSCKGHSYWSAVCGCNKCLKQLGMAASPRKRGRDFWMNVRTLGKGQRWTMGVSAEKASPETCSSFSAAWVTTTSGSDIWQEE